MLCLTFTKSKGVILKFNDGTEEWAGHNEYTEIPASTEESVTEYLALEDKVDNLATNAYAILRGMAQNVITDTDALNAANRLYRTFTTGGVAGSIENLHRIIINLETAKEEITEQTEAVLWKFEHLINRAYGA